jgi:hypothetical protein
LKCCWTTATRNQPGHKFADMELIGIHRIVVSDRGLPKAT